MRGRPVQALSAVLLLAGSLLTLTPGEPPAHAAARDAEPTTLKIAISDIKPLAPVATSTLVVTGTVTNTGTTRVSALTIALEDIGPAVTRADLDVFRLAPPVVGRQLTVTKRSSELAPGAVSSFQLSVPDVGQQLGDPSRVYELSVVGNGAIVKDGAVAPLGVAALPLPYFTPAAPITGRLRTAFVIPMTAVPDQGPLPLTGVSPEPASSLINELKSGGRLDRLLSVIEAAPPAGGNGGTQLTLAVDPALLDRVCALAGRCGQHTVVGTPASDSQLASNWLSRLSAAVDSPEVTVVGLPYADADVAAMTAAGDTAAVVQLLQHAGPRVDRDLTSAATTDLQPLLPVDGLADDALTAAAVRAGDTVAVVSSALFDPVTPTVTGPVTASASTQLSTSAGTLPALVTDGGLQGLLTTAGDSPRLQEQNLLAELAVITSERPNNQASRTVVLEAPRDWDVPLDFSTRLVDALGTVGYVASEGLGTLEGAPPGDPRVRTRTPPRPAPAPLPSSSINTIDNARTRVDALHWVAADPETESISPPFGEGLDRMLSAWWRGPRAGQGADQLSAITMGLTNTVGKVSVGGSSNGVLLTGPSGTLPVQVYNLLKEPIAIVVHVKSDGLDQVTGRDESKVFDSGTASHQVSVPITTRSTRSVNVTVQLLTQSHGAPIAERTIPVRSTSVGKVAVGITAAALTLLVLLIVFRAGRRIAASRRGAPSA